jgi:hypothetical protein
MGEPDDGVTVPLLETLPRTSVTVYGTVFAAAPKAPDET